MLTLVIPNFNRPHFLARLLKYYVDSQFPFAVIIADSSNPDGVELNRRTVSLAMKTLRIEHQTFSSEMHPCLKLAQTLATSSTRYALVCADDDFIIGSSVSECLEFLEANSDYAVARGYATIVEPGPNPNNGAAEFTSFVYPQRAVESNDALSRVSEHLESYTSTFYSIHRRDELAVNLEKSFEHTVDYRFGELLPSCLSVIQGKVACLDLLFMVRQGERAAGTVKYGANMLPWNELAQRDDFQSRYADFEDCLVKECTKTGEIEVAAAKVAIRRAFDSYLRQAIEIETGSTDSSNQSWARNAAARVGRVLASAPNVLRELATSPRPADVVNSPRDFYRRALAKRDNLSLESLTDPRSSFSREFQPIYELLVKYPNGLPKDALVDGHDAIS